MGGRARAGGVSTLHHDLGHVKTVSGWRMNKEVPPPTAASEGVCERLGLVRGGRCGVAIRVALPVVRRVVADPELEAVQPLPAAIAAIPYRAADGGLGGSEIHAPPIAVIITACMSEGVQIPVVCHVAADPTSSEISGVKPPIRVV
jgi:hypothetical protein